METVYEFCYNSDTYESCTATMSIHKTQKGAEMAMEFHRNEEKKKYDDITELMIESNPNYKEEFPFGYDEDWFIRETELKD